MDQLANFVAYSPLAQPISSGLELSQEAHGSAQLSVLKGNTTPRLLSARLNPYFGELLMGWPLNWTSATALNACGASETELWRSKLAQHLSILLDEQGSLDKEAA